jgi:hypothetical protein
MISTALSFAMFHLGGFAWQVSKVLAAQSVPLVSLLLFGGSLPEAGTLPTNDFRMSSAECA